MGGMDLVTLDVGYELDIDDYKIIFNILNEEHNKYCKDWISSNEEKFNLKRKCVCDIYTGSKGIEETFKKYMNSFLVDLNCLDFKIMENIYDVYDFNLYVRRRTKEYASIIYKLHKKSNQDNGKYPIQKCLNDLLGYRIVDKNYNNNIDNIIEHLEHLRHNKGRIKHINRNNDGYKGYHIYFLGPDNYSFPIELQIWDSEDEQRNMELHNMYKQEYFEWIRSYTDFK